MTLSKSRIFSNKLTLTLAVILMCYALLRVIALFQHQTVTLPGDYFSYHQKEVRYLCKGEGAPYVFFETGFGHHF